MIIKWMLGIFKKVSKPSLYVQIMGAKALVRRKHWVMTYRNLP